MHVGTLKSCGLFALSILLAAGQLGCVTRLLGIGGEPQVEGSRGKVPLARVERLIDSFADRQVTLIADACEAVKREMPEAAQRRRLHHMKLANGTAVYDIITHPNPLARLADLYILVELEYLVWADEGRAYRQFGQFGKDRLVAALEEIRRDMSRLADLAMKPERRQRLDGLIRRWRERNPDVQFIAGIRFGALPEAGGKSILESASSFFDVINPMDDTSQTVEKSRALAERAFHYSRRLPRLIDWQAEAAFDDTMAKPEVQAVLQQTDRIGASVDRISRTFQELPDRVAAERREILAAWDARNREVLGSAREIHATVVDARGLAVEATQTAKAFEGAFRELNAVLGDRRHDPEAPPSRPFDIREVTEAAAQLRELAREGSGVVSGTKSLVDYVIIRIAMLAVLFVVLLLGYRLVVVRWIKPASPPPRDKDHRPPTTLEPRYGSPT
jgi:hypothetical protein